MRHIIILCIALAGCKTSNIQNVTYNVHYNPVYSSTLPNKTFSAPLSDLDRLPEQRDVQQLESIMSSLPDAIQVTGRKPNVNVRGVQAIDAPAVQGDSNIVADRKVSVKPQTRNVENETGWLVWIGVAVVVAGLVFALIRFK